MPTPQLKPGHVLVGTTASVISIGTERSMLELAQKSLMAKALARRDLARKVVEKVQTEGPLEAWRQVRGRLDRPVPLGYSSSGVVLHAGPDVTDLLPGDRVACAGAGFSGHATEALIPKSLCVKIPDNVDFESAAFVALGAIALESVRMAKVSLGETVVVIGMGLVGLLTGQLLQAAGCNVVAVDVDGFKIEVARSLGFEAAVQDFSTAVHLVHEATSRQGADAVVISAATRSNEPLMQAAEIARERARIVATGVVGLTVPRQTFYDKELELVVSRAWGPGLYDAEYTERNLDYPPAYARWTARRNMRAFLEQIGTGSVVVHPLITHRFPFIRAEEAYELILAEGDRAVGVVITYPEGTSPRPSMRRVWKAGMPSASKVSESGMLGLGVIGAGAYATGTLLPALKKIDHTHLRGIASLGGLSAQHAAERFGFDYCCSDPKELLSDPQVNAVVILTRHSSHADLTVDALRAGKHVFVEKPLAIDEKQLRIIVEAFRRHPRLITVTGFNRRYSPAARWLQQNFGEMPGPFAVHWTVNAGPLDSSSWVRVPDEGGGRIIGELCHFIDMATFFTASLPAHVYAAALESASTSPDDNVAATVKMRDGSIVSILYVANGAKRFPRERLEIFGGGAVGIIDNFRRASFTRSGRTRRMSRISVDRGHIAALEAFVAGVRSGIPPVDPAVAIATTAATFAIERSLRAGRPEPVDLSMLADWDTENVR